MAAVTFPLDLIDTEVFWTRSFRLRVRQEVSRVSGGTTIRKEIGSPLWYAEYQSIRLLPSELDYWRSRLDLMEGGIQTFCGVNPSRCRPIAYPSKAGFFPGFNGIGNLVIINADNKRLNIGGVPNGYRASAGDLIQVGDNDLYSVVNSVTAGADGFLYEVEVRPHVWPSTAAGASVRFLRPSCIMALDPDTVDIDIEPSTGRGTVSFAAWEVR